MIIDRRLCVGAKGQPSAPVKMRIETVYLVQSRTHRAPNRFRMTCLFTSGVI